MVRYEAIEKFLSGNVSKEMINDFMIRKYPEGLSCDYHSKFFGTIYQIIFDIDRKEMEVCYGGGTQRHRICAEKEYKCLFTDRKPQADFFDIVNPGTVLRTTGKQGEGRQL